MRIVDPVESDTAHVTLADRVEALIVIHELTCCINRLPILRREPTGAGRGKRTVPAVVASPPPETERRADRVGICAQDARSLPSAAALMAALKRATTSGSVGLVLLDDVRVEEGSQPAADWRTTREGCWYVPGVGTCVRLIGPSRFDGRLRLRSASTSAPRSRGGACASPRFPRPPSPSRRASATARHARGL